MLRRCCRIVFFLSVFPVFSSITFAQQAPPEAPVKGAQQPTVIIYLKSGENWPAQIVDFDAQKRLLYLHGLGHQREIGFDEIDLMIVERQPQPSTGVLMATSLGCLAGSLFGNMLYQDSEEDLLLNDRPLVLIFGCLGGGAGLLAGSVATAASGSNSHVRFEKLSERQKIIFLKRITRRRMSRR